MGNREGCSNQACTSVWVPINMREGKSIRDDKFGNYNLSPLLPGVNTDAEIQRLYEDFCNDIKN